MKTLDWIWKSNFFIVQNMWKPLKNIHFMFNLKINRKKNPAQTQ